MIESNWFARSFTPALMVRSRAQRGVSNHGGGRGACGHPSRRPPSLRSGGLLRMRAV
jgi:hypothetical protein